MTPAMVPTPDASAMLERQLAGLRRAIAELDHSVLVHLPAEPAYGWRGPARDAYGVVLDRLRRHLIVVRGCLVRAQALTIAALAAEGTR